MKEKIDIGLEVKQIDTSFTSVTFEDQNILFFSIEKKISKKKILVV